MNHGHHPELLISLFQTGTFIWLDGAHWEYADWLPGEPNDTSGVENCVELLSELYTKTLRHNSVMIDTILLLLLMLRGTL